MKIIRYLGRLQQYLTMVGLLGLLQIIITKAKNSTTLLRVDRSDCQHHFTLRYPSTDIRTFEQIFMYGAYDFLVETQPNVIVDAGANIGLASIYLANRFPNAKIISLEPEIDNFELLKINVAPYPNIIPLQVALWHKNEEICLMDSGRGKWGFVVRSKEGKQQSPETPQNDMHHTVMAVTVDKLMEKYELDRINILKIDIEGAEKEVFSDSTPWIDKIDSLIIELHEFLRPGCNHSFYNGSDGFDQEWLQGENVIRTRVNWLKKYPS